MVAFDEAGRVVEFVEKPDRRHVPSPWGNAGIYLCGPRALEYAAASDGQQDFAYDVFPRMLAGGCRLVAYPTNAPVFEFGSIERLERTAAAVRNGLGKGLLTVPVRA